MLITSVKYVNLPMPIRTDKIQTSVYSVVVNVLSIHPALFCIESFELTVYVIQDGDTAKDNIT